MSELTTRKRLFLLFIVMALLLVGGWTYTLKTSTPAGTDDPAEADDRMREIKGAFVERLDVDHYWTASATSTYDATDTGKHDRVTFVEAADIGTGATGYPILGAQTVTAPELTWVTEGDSDLQITDNGTLNITSSDLVGTLANDTYFTAVDAAGTGTVNLIKANASDVAVIPDGSELATSGAPTADADIANKKYVDDEVADKTGGDAAVANDSDGNSFLKSHAYLAQTAGFVSSYIVSNTITELAGWIDTDSNPITGGQKVGRADGGATAIQPDIYFYVPNGQYFEITASVSDADLRIYWTPLETGGAAPVDQD